MNIKACIVAAILSLFALPAAAQLEVYEDYTISDEVWDITTIKVDANMADYYLEGLKSTWIEASELSKELGQIEEYVVLVSALPESGDFNMLLGVKYSSLADYAPSEELYREFMTAWGEANADASRETVKTYPELRKITGQYLMHELILLEPEEE